MLRWLQQLPLDNLLGFGCTSRNHLLLIAFRDALLGDFVFRMNVFTSVCSLFNEIACHRAGECFRACMRTCVRLLSSLELKRIDISNLSPTLRLPVTPVAVRRIWVNWVEGERVMPKSPFAFYHRVATKPLSRQNSSPSIPPSNADSLSHRIDSNPRKCDAVS